MSDERLTSWRRSPKEATDGLNRIFEQNEVVFGGIKVGDPKEDGSKATWKDVLECFKEDLRAGDKYGDLDGVSDRGFMMLIVQASDQLPADLKIRAINFFDEVFSVDKALPSVS